MVNYCCVFGCSRNSRYNKHLTYYSLPKERDRQIQWLRAAGRDDLLEKGELRMSHRVCSRHFSQSSIKNRLLCPDAVPTLCLRQVGANDDTNSYEPMPHEGVICNNCNTQIVGFRYKCVTCSDYDLCQKCEMLETHSNHCMIRIPKPVEKSSDSLVKEKWNKFLKSDEITKNYDGTNSDSSSDDEPITKYAKNYDSGVDLSEDIKQKIRREVTRVLNLTPEKKKAKRSGEENNLTFNKKFKMEFNNIEGTSEQKLAPEFADVNDIESQIVDFKVETVPSAGLLTVQAADALAKSSNETQGPVVLPTMHVKLSDDLSELLIEVTSNSEKTVYKYPQ